MHSVRISYIFSKSLTCIPIRGVRVLGTPFGSEELLAEYGMQIASEEAQLLEHIPKLASLQASWLLLYFCAVPRINHLLRNVPPSLVRSTAVRHDNAIQTVFKTLFGISDADAWDEGLHQVTHQACMKQATLPHRLAGCGLRDSARTSPAAYWASWADSISVLQSRFPAIGARKTLLSN